MTVTFIHVSSRIVTSLVFIICYSYNNNKNNVELNIMHYIHNTSYDIAILNSFPTINKLCIQYNYIYIYILLYINYLYINILPSSAPVEHVFSIDKHVNFQNEIT